LRSDELLGEAAGMAARDPFLWAALARVAVRTREPSFCRTCCRPDRATAWLPDRLFRALHGSLLQLLLCLCGGQLLLSRANSIVGHLVASCVPYRQNPPGHESRV